MVMSERLEKIGTTELIKVKSHARELYLPLRAELIHCFGLKKGDILKVKIEGKILTPGGST